jgi:hypothetical protein
MRQKRYIPGKALSSVPDRKEKHAALVQFITKRKGYVTSIPGEPELRFEALPGSTLPDELTELGYAVTEIGEGQRILPGSIVERFSLTSSGALEPVAEGSTKAVALLQEHAGIVGVLRYRFQLP